MTSTVAIDAMPNCRYKKHTKNRGSLLRHHSTNNNQKCPVIIFTAGAFLLRLSVIVLNVGGS
jgi:hypothetical protein